MRFQRIIGCSSLILTMVIIGVGFTSKPELEIVRRADLATQIVLNSKPEIETINKLRAALEEAPNGHTSQASVKLQIYLNTIEKASPETIKDQIKTGQLLVQECAIDDQKELIARLTQRHYYLMAIALGTATILSLLIIISDFYYNRLIYTVEDVLTGKTKNLESALLSLRQRIKDHEHTNSDLRQIILQLKRKQPQPLDPPPPQNQSPRFSPGLPGKQGISLHSITPSNPSFKAKELSPETPNESEPATPPPIQASDESAPHKLPSEPMNISDFQEPSAQLATFLQQQHTGGFTALRFSGPLFSETKDIFPKELNPNTKSSTVIEINFENLERIKQIYRDDYDTIFKTICKETVNCLNQIDQSASTVKQTDQTLYWEIKADLTENELNAIYQQFEEIYQNIVINWKMNDELIRITIPPVKFNIFGSSSNHQAIAV